MAAQGKPKPEKQTSPEGFLPLTNAVFHILIALADGEAHGYAIMQTVAQRSDGAVRLGPGTLYGAVGRLLEDGLIEECGKPPVTKRATNEPTAKVDDERRRYYRLTTLGARVLTAETERLSDLVRVARSTKAARQMKPA
jgi:DNA-binding PadR family transcriptional regulator